MTNIESDELLREVIDALGEIRGLLVSRLPQPAKVDDTPVDGVRQAVVTGEGDQAIEAREADRTPPVTPAAIRKATPKRR